MVERGLLDFIIARLPELSFREKLRLCKTCNTESDIIQKSKAEIESMIGHPLAVWDIDPVRRQAARDAETARQRGISWVSWQDAAYPPLLREIYDPPPLLFFRGALPNPEKPLAAVVGTRKPSAQASAQAFAVAKELGYNGISVVSGLAIGIDSMAHRGNIEGGSPTIAVLGSGVDEVYPSSNRQLAVRILETGGALLSEYPPGVGPRKWSFPARNRIISGLSRGVVIVEAPQKSGALITARFAVDQNRELWIACAGVKEDKAVDRRGTIKLASEGAQIISSASDILSAWNMPIRTPARMPEQQRRGASGKQEGAALALSLASELGITL
jgi:DNA processing protein